MTSCGCFEVICAYVPECNGVMVVNREFQGETPGRHDLLDAWRATSAAASRPRASWAAARSS